MHEVVVPIVTVLGIAWAGRSRDVPALRAYDSDDAVLLADAGFYSFAATLVWTCGTVECMIKEHAGAIYAI